MNHRLMRIITVLQSPLFTLFRGRFMVLPTLRLTVTGRRTGRDRRVLLLFGVDGERLAVVASAGRRAVRSAVVQEPAGESRGAG